MMDQVRKLRSPTSPLSPASETEEEGRDGKFLTPPLTRVHKSGRRGRWEPNNLTIYSGCGNTLLNLFWATHRAQPGAED